MAKTLIQPTIQTLDEFTPYAAEHGFEFELVDWVEPDLEESEYAKLVKEYTARLKEVSAFSVHGAFIDLYIHSPVRAVREQAQKTIRKNLAAAQSLGVQYVVFHTNYLPMLPAQPWIDGQVAFWSKVIKDYDLTVLLEPMWDKDPQNLEAVLDAVDSPKLQVCFDTGHCAVFSDVPMSDWFATLGSRIPYIHVNDNQGKEDQELPVGEGIIDWKAFTGLVDAHCDNPHLVIENWDLPDIRTSVAYMTKHGVYPF
jgi:sugar phosphate isomerase/epimerase